MVAFTYLCNNVIPFHLLHKMIFFFHFLKIWVWNYSSTIVLKDTSHGLCTRDINIFVVIHTKKTQHNAFLLCDFQNMQFLKMFIG